MALFRRNRQGDSSPEEAARIVNRLGSIIDRVESTSVQATASLPWLSREASSEEGNSPDCEAEFRAEVRTATIRGTARYLDSRDRRDEGTPLAAHIG